MLWPQSINVRLTTQLKGELKDWTLPTLPLPWYLNEFGWKTSIPIVAPNPMFDQHVPHWNCARTGRRMSGGSRVFLQESLNGPWNWTGRWAFGTASYFVKKPWVSGRFPQRNPVWNHQCLGHLTSMLGGSSGDPFDGDNLDDILPLGIGWVGQSPGFPGIATPQKRIKKIENMVNSIGNQNPDLWVFGATIDSTGDQSMNPLLLWNETPTPQRLGVGQFALIIWT